MTCWFTPEEEEEEEEEHKEVVDQGYSTSEAKRATFKPQQVQRATNYY